MSQNKKFIKHIDVAKLVNSLKDRRHITAKSIELKEDVLKLKSHNANQKIENKMTGEEMVVLLVNKDPRYLPMLCMKRIYSQSFFSEAFLEKLWRYGESEKYNKSIAMKMIDENTISGKGFRLLDPPLLSNINYNYLKQLAQKKKNGK